MNILTVQEAAQLMHSYGIKCDINKVKEWLSEGKLNSKEYKGTYTISEEDVYNFLEAYRWEGTAYEQGIDDITKISRLLEEIADLRQEVCELKKENGKLVDQLGILPF
ncbi:helix-turn-helix domain-containing protein [Mesobacillus maritimus]|uniref:Helix-turn-helix domain-containing protein n=1 Tax=Mesobacillus maritimus TaxID=1643336 RepID=A0ABS7K4W0_9BACI|nr:helix-turn-helix domain-containing protein [Mesobacillus maritimus]MBY0097312.1 helix-turn-helix domain-containing protein [Mesobacillus maritimus]